MVIEVRLLPMGDRAVLAEVGSLAEVLALHAALQAALPLIERTGTHAAGGVSRAWSSARPVELVPAARTVLVAFDPGRMPVSAVRGWIAEIAGQAAVGDAPTEADEVEVPVVYDGPDLADTAALLGIDVGSLVARHRAAEWTVAFTGFAPGFGYLVSDDWPYDVPRLESPRTRVPVGAVGLAGGFTGAYPRETPGGWRLIATTDAVLLDPDAAQPALLTPGARVRFRESVASGRATARAARTGDPTTADSAFTVVEPGLLATVQDLGRPGAASLGVSHSGALDRAALRAANRLVGNDEDAAVIEVTMGGFRAIADRDLWFAVTGAWGPITVDDEPIDPYDAHVWPRGRELHLDWFAHGARAYLAVRGGVGGAAILDSRSTDVLSGLGPARLAAGTRIAPAGAAAREVPPSVIAPWGAPHDDELEIELAPGPRADWFTPDAQRTLYESVWTVTNDADRIGMRLDGPELARARTDELPSEGMVPGALQVPPSGRPTVLLADGPVTGGYPVIAVVAEGSLDLLAQARPGTRVRLRHARPA
ncbi:urea amidolyase family protein [Microbacterium awajiense]|uniref:Urea amidolyase family protein n=1 Tax=Microbacterium awajiense TaxID=415214 RepID=A0ABP7AJX2_9MICO